MSMVSKLVYIKDCMMVVKAVDYLKDLASCCSLENLVEKIASNHYFGVAFAALMFDVVFE